MGQSRIDALVGNDAEDLVADKLHPNTGKGDEAAHKVSEDGGTSKLPSRPAPFTIKGGE